MLNDEAGNKRFQSIEFGFIFPAGFPPEILPGHTFLSKYRSHVEHITV